MQKDLFEQWNTFGKSAYESFKVLAEINTSVFEKLTEQQLEALNVYMETGAKQVSLLGESKGYQDLLSSQASLANEANEKLLSVARNVAGILNDSKNEITSWVEKGIETAVTPVTKPATTKKAA